MITLCEIDADEFILNQIQPNIFANRFDLRNMDYKVIKVSTDNQTYYIEYAVHDISCDIGICLMNIEKEAFDEVLKYLQNKYKNVVKFRFVHSLNSFSTQTPSGNHYILELDETFEQYLSHFSSKFRYNLKRERRLASENLNYKIKHYFQQEINVPLIEKMFVLKNTNDKCRFKSAKEFIQTYLPTDLYAVEIDDEIVAIIVYSILDNNNCYCLSMAYDSKYARYSLGKLLYYYTIEDLISNKKIQKIYMGGGYHDYKAQAKCKIIPTYSGKIKKITAYNCLNYLNNKFFKTAKRRTAVESNPLSASKKVCSLESEAVK